MFAVMFNLFIHEHLRDQIHGFVDQGADFLHVVAEASGFLLRAAFANAEMQAAVGQKVECGDALGHFDRVVHGHGQADHAVTNVNARRPAGDEGQESFRRGHVGVLRERRMLHGPDAIEAEFVGEQTLLDHVLEHAVLGGA
jgi:hypothetical protein